MCWGWRLPFLPSFLLVLVGLYIRYRVMETPVFREAVAAGAAAGENRRWNRSAAIPATSSCCLARASPRTASAICSRCSAQLCDDRAGRPSRQRSARLWLPSRSSSSRSRLRGSLGPHGASAGLFVWRLVGIALAFPFFLMVGTRSGSGSRLPSSLSRAVVTAAMFGPQAAYFAELFAPQRRFSGFAFARELGSLLAGGPAPFVATALVAWAGAGGRSPAMSCCSRGSPRSRSGAGPETYEENISVDNTSDGVMIHPTALPQQGIKPRGAATPHPAVALGDGAAAADEPDGRCRRAGHDPRRRLRRRRRAVHRPGLRDARSPLLRAHGMSWQAQCYPQTVDDLKPVLALCRIRRRPPQPAAGRAAATGSRNACP